MPSTLLNSVNLVSQISSGSDTMQCRNAVLTTCESLLQLGEAWRKSDFGEGHCRLQNNTPSSNPHKTCRLPTYSPKGGPATTIRPVGCQHTAPKAVQKPSNHHKTCRLPTYSPQRRSSSHHKTCRLPTYSSKLTKSYPSGPPREPTYSPTNPKQA